MPGTGPAGPEVEEVARSVLAGCLGGRSRVDRWEPLQATGAGAVLRVTLASGQLLVLKLVAVAAGWRDYGSRTAGVIGLVRAAGAPVPAVLAGGTDSGWDYLLLEHANGTTWQRLRPGLDAAQVAAVHRQLAAAVLAVQSVRFPAFGDLDADARPVPAGLLEVLNRRAAAVRDEPRQSLMRAVLERDAALLAAAGEPTVTHDDLHHGNVVVRMDGDQPRLVAVLDWDKAWPGPAGSDVARMAYWDGMTGPGFWAVYRAAVPEVAGDAERALVYQLLWCLEYDPGTARHRRDTAELCRRLGVRPPRAG